ncbi:lysin A glycosidase domain [Mycobacterium phage Bipper]|uniref:Lysin A glycosidase domain n=1 Tax=Mycobacterium phage Bipper TaxID=1805457 RepID=A0A142F2G1_9CAUD|nr:endolysin [Mycobacterium phage Bipper]AMQ66968.1 lysin A glycosidase domain [Mycobacterium phage Bipper]
MSAVDVLSQAMLGSVSRERYAQLLPALSECLVRCGCTTVPRIAMFNAQVGHESAGLLYMSEIWGPTAAQCGYEWRTDLGNTVAGDGYRFRGRGPLQVTGRGHYTNLSRWAYSQGLVPTPTFFVDDPDQLAGDRYGFIGVTWYWTVERPQLNALADARDIVGATRAVNGGTNGLEDGPWGPGRRTRWNRNLAMGSALLSLLEQQDWQPVLDYLQGRTL